MTIRGVVNRSYAKGFEDGGLQGRAALDRIRQYVVTRHQLAVRDGADVQPWTDMLSVLDAEPQAIRHPIVHREGSPHHVRWYDTRGIHCSEPDCDWNLKDERESSLGRDTEGHLVLTLGPGAESPSRKAGWSEYDGMSPLEQRHADGDR